MSKQDLEGKNTLFGPNSNVKKDFECQNSIFGQSSNVKIGLRMSKCDIQLEFECQNMISNIRVRYSTEFESQIRFRMSNAIFGPSSKAQKGYRLSKCDIRPQFECQNMISNVEMRYSARI